MRWPESCVGSDQPRQRARLFVRAFTQQPRPDVGDTGQLAGLDDRRQVALAVGALG